MRPESLAGGTIRHAFSMPAKDVNNQRFVAPALKTDGQHPEGVPMGMRFALDATDAEINAWIKSLPAELSARTRKSARTIAVGLRDYGWFITDSSGGAFLQFEYNGTAAEKWAELGLSKRTIRDNQYPRDLLDGLLVKDRIYALGPSDEYSK